MGLVLLLFLSSKSVLDSNLEISGGSCWKNLSKWFYEREPLKLLCQSNLVEGLPQFPP